MMESQRALILHQLWMAGETLEAIGKRFGVSASTVSKWVDRYKLPSRERPVSQRVVDPTPDEIRERARECRRRHYAERRKEVVV